MRSTRPKKILTLVVVTSLFNAAIYVTGQKVEKDDSGEIETTNDLGDHTVRQTKKEKKSKEPKKDKKTKKPKRDKEKKTKKPKGDKEKKTKNPKGDKEKKTKKPKGGKNAKAKKSKNAPTPHLTVEPTMVPTNQPTRNNYATEKPTVNKYPYCNVPNPTWVGDAWCHGEPYNTPECGWDGGDCPAPFPNCTLTLSPRFQDGLCDEEFNVEECGFDGGDCEFDCYGKGNGVCEKKNNNAYCDFDGGDCAEFNARFPDCKAEYPEYIGDGDCNAVDPYNTTACGYDGGDCLVDGGRGQNKTNTVSIPSSRHLFQIILEYFYPQTGDEILEWQKL